MPRVALVTDSTACVAEEPGARVPASASLALPDDVRVVDLHVVSDGVQRDELSLRTAPVSEVVEFLSGKRVSTSRPSPQVFLDAYERAARAGAEAVVSVHLSGRLSGTVESARLAATASPVPVQVVDSLSVGAALAASVRAAHRAAQRGGTAEQVAATALACADDASVIIYVDSLDHLRRGGRIGAAQHLLGSALAMKPILEIDDGAVAVRAQVRTVRRALDRVVDDVAATVEDAPHGADVYVQTLVPGQDADLVEAALRERCAGTPVVRLQLGAVIGAHVGPGVVGVTVVPRLAPGALGAFED